MNSKIYIVYVVIMAFVFSANAQHNDSVNVNKFNTVNITDKYLNSGIERLPEIQGTIIYSGKKNEVIMVNSLDADLSTNNQRQIFGRVPGITIWENDGSGIQTGIATRGLSPNRSWEFNVRQNGYDISSEVFGYSEAYFAPPSEALSKIELVRGAASLQFGPQFGGLLNYEIKKGDPNKILSFETQQTLGSFGLYNAFNAIGGTYKKLTYYGYFHHRNADGWRENSNYRTNTGYASLQYKFNNKLSLSMDYSHMQYQSQQPGGFADSVFLSSAIKTSTRSRNWFSAPWNVSSISLDYQWNENTRLQVKIFATIAGRNSVGYIKSINIEDTFNYLIGSFNPRQVDQDKYRNFGGEMRFLKMYSVLKNKSAISAGIRIYDGTTIRKQQGIGTTGADMDFAISALSNNKMWGKSLEYNTKNMALFFENIFKISKKLSLTPGARYEIVNSIAQGYINTTNSGSIGKLKRNRNVLLFGIGAEYITSSTSNLYANFSQSYRPITFSELTPVVTTDVIDPNLKDASGYNADLGFRGKYKNILKFDVGVFYLYYHNRIGTISKNNLAFRTNIGTSVSKGLESYIELNPVNIFTNKSRFGYIRLFSSFAWIEAIYTKWNNPEIANIPEKSILNKRVEYAPKLTGRYGIMYMFKRISATFQINTVSDVYTDAVNTENSNAAGTIGKISAYTVMDFSVTYNPNNLYNVKFGVNNLANEKYATRRAGGYPGPGLMPGSPRTLYISIGAKL